MDEEVDRKRKNGGLSQELDDDALALSLSIPYEIPRSPAPLPTLAQAPSTPRPPLLAFGHIHIPPHDASTSDPNHRQAEQQQPPSRHAAQQPPPHYHAAQQPPPHRRVAPQQPAQQRTFRTRRNPTQSPRGNKRDIIEPPFPWATNRRATIYSLDQLLARGIETIRGQVQCKRCEVQEVAEYDLREKFAEVARFIATRKHAMHDRAPPEWMSPQFPGCRKCAQANCMKPVLAEKKRKINWLFMLLSQTLGCCTLEQLKYFCKHTKNHRTGAKDRVLYLTYLGLCKQLDPTGPFDR